MAVIDYLFNSVVSQTLYANTMLQDNICLKVLGFCFIFLLASVSAGYSDNTVTRNQPGLSLEETFDLYVRAIQNIDLEGLFTTVTDSDDFFFLSANGKLIGREGYYDFHEDWFKEKDWEMPVKLLRIHEGNEYGYTNAVFYYRSKLPDGSIYNLESYFTLIFHKEDMMWKVIADICTPISRYLKEPESDIQYNTDQLFLLKTIKERRTVRKFKSASIPDEHIMKILDAARFAPTAGNQQPWKFLVIRDRAKLDQLKKEALSWYLETNIIKKQSDQKELENARKAIQDMLEGVLSAPVYIAVLVDSKAAYPEYISYDGTLAAGYLMIAARALGYGTGFFTAFFPEEKMKSFFNIPDQYRLICFTPIGIPESWPDVPPKKSLEEIVIFESF